MTPDDVTSFVERAAAGDLSEDVLNWLASGLRAWLRSDGELPLERCLRLPRSHHAQRIARRDRALRRAAQLLVRPTPRATYVALEAAWSRFVSGPLWRAWRDDAQAPMDASEVHQVLFVASREHGSSARGTLSARHLQRIVEAVDDV